MVKPLRNPGDPELYLGDDYFNIFNGFGGNDTILGFGGRDVLMGGADDDSIDAGPGRDVVFGGRGNDFIVLGSDNDRAFGGFGDDTIDTGTGRDFVFGGAGTDTTIVPGDYADYEFQWIGRSGNATLTWQGEDGTVETKRLFKVEILQFDDATIYLDGRNNAPIAKDDTAATDENATLTIDAADLLANDADFEGDTLSIVDVDPLSAAGATATLDGGQITYEPGTVFDSLATGDTTVDSIVYTVSDGNGGESQATVNITITGVNDAPVLAGPAAVDFAENGTGVVASYVATDPDDTALTYSLAGDDAALFSIDATGVLTFNSAPDYETPVDAGGDNVYDVTVVVEDDEGAQDSIDLAVTVTDVAEYSLVISEIMFNPASAEDDWEWIEVVNTGATDIDLSGWVIDDSNSVAHDAANIASGTVAAGGSAILYNADDISAADFEAAWGTGINLVAVANWGAMALNNGGDTVGLWSDFASYSGDNATQANAVISVTYDGSLDDGAGSIYLTDLLADPNDFTNWALSTDGGATPVNTGEIAAAAGGNSGADIGSPGGVTPAGDVKLSEFQPNPTGTDPANVSVELTGNPGGVFDGWLISVENDGPNGLVDRAAQVSGTFDANGILTVEIPDLENPSFTFILTDVFTGSTSTDIDADDDGTVDDLSAFGTIYDALGIPDSDADAATMYGAQLGGADFAFTGDEPQLVFRDGTSGDWYAINDPAGTDAYDIDGNAAAFADFDADPSVPTFGAMNPSFIGGPVATAALINEFQPNPTGTDPATVQIELKGEAGASFSGWLVAIENDGPNGTVDRAEAVSGTFDANGLLTVEVADLENPSFTYVLTDSFTGSVGSTDIDANDDGTVDDTSAFGAIYDAIGIPDSDSDATTMYGTQLGGADFVYTGSEPQLVFRDGATGDWWAVNDPAGTDAVALDGSTTAFADFDADPVTTTFGAINPSAGAAPRAIAINELRVNQSGTDLDEFFELYSADASTSLDNLFLVGISGEFAPGQIDFVFDLSAGSFDADGVFMIARDTLSTGTFDAGDLTLPSSVNLFGSPATYLLVEGFTGTIGADLDTDNDGVLDGTPWTEVLDAVSMVDGDVNPDLNYAPVVIGPDGSFTFAGAAALPDGSDDFVGLDFASTALDTPGRLNGGGTGNGDTTLISAIQGSGAATPLAGQTVTVQAIVVGDFQNGDGDAARNLGGFFLQEEASDHDADTATSEGIFIYEGSGGFLTDVNVGDLVTVTGTVSEFGGLTEITATSIAIDAAGAVSDVNAMAAIVDLDAAPAISDGAGGYVADLEAYEGMLVTVGQTLTVSEMFNFDRFGEIRLTAGGQPVQFTQENEPDAAGYDAHLQQVYSDSIVYDDGKTIQNPAIPFAAADMNGDGVFNTEDPFSMGDTIANATGVLTWAFGEYRMHSIADDANTFVDADQREETPPSMDEPDGRTADIVVASFNVLNFFTTIDDGVNTSGPTNLEPRGADNPEEYARQFEKLITALTAMDADIFGLVELENEFQSDQNGDGTFAIQAIVDGLNAGYGAGTWAYVDPGRTYVDVSDAISVGMIYKTDVVSVSGPAQILDDSVLPSLPGSYGTDALFDGSSTNRAPLAANFTYDYTDLGGTDVSETFTVAVAHMKSKGGTGTGGDADAGDGAGNYNETRTEGVNALTDWLDPDRAGAFADADQIVLGDFNAYAMEDPIDAMKADGYTDLEGTFNPGATTYVFDGQTGTLDYAFASADLLDNVTNAAAWHINSPEPDIFDYNNDFGRDVDIFDGTVPYRSSDHDPMLLGLNFSNDPADILIG